MVYLQWMWLYFVDLGVDVVEGFVEGLEEMVFYVGWYGEFLIVDHQRPSAVGLFDDFLSHGDEPVTVGHEIDAFLCLE